MTLGDGTGADILQLSANDQIADTSILTFNGTGANAGTFRLNFKSETVGGLASAGGAGVVENSTSGTSTLTVSNATDRIFSGILQNGAAGTLAFVKSGDATQTLTGENMYSGGTSVSVGTLALGGSGTLGNGSALILSGGALDLGT